MSRRRTRRNARTDQVNEPAIDNTPIPDSVPAVPDAFTDADLDELATVDTQAIEDAEAIDAAASEDRPMPPDGAGDEFEGSPVDRIVFDQEPDEEPEDLPYLGLDQYDPPFDPEIFERGALAAGIRMCEALLTQAKAGYINEQIDELARVLDVDFPDPERFFLGQVAARETTASGLPDVAGAYQALIRAKAQVA